MVIPDGRRSVIYVKLASEAGRDFLEKTKVFSSRWLPARIAFRAYRVR